MFNPMTLIDKLISGLYGLSHKAKTIIIGIFLVLVLASGITAYKINNYFNTNPDACVLCHVHDYAQDSWAQSEHAAVICKDCHYSSKKDQVAQLYRFVFLGHKTVEPRHGKVIVPKKFCMECHWETNKKYPHAPLVNNSRYHIRHAEAAGLECTDCHGFVVHKFPADEKICFKCHVGKEVHGTGMEKLACLNCHTDRTHDLKPGPKKCLFCHGDESIKEELIADGTLDVRHFQPSEETIKKAQKINQPADAPMQFYCYECHKPHHKARPDWNDCIKCHSSVMESGMHILHIKDIGMSCKDCHKPHVWIIKEEQAKRDCVKCHEYKDPKKFRKM